MAAIAIRVAKVLLLAVCYVVDYARKGKPFCVLASVKKARCLLATSILSGGNDFGALLLPLDLHGHFPAHISVHIFNPFPRGRIHVCHCPRLRPRFAFCLLLP